jgi:NADH-quinone oxidoreductase subunit L
MLSAIVFLPLIGFLIAGLFGACWAIARWRSSPPAWSALAAVLSWIVFIETGFGDVHGHERVQVRTGFLLATLPSIGRSASIRCDAGGGELGRARSPLFHRLHEP